MRRRIIFSLLIILAGWQTDMAQTKKRKKAIDRGKADTESIKTSQMAADTLRIQVPISRGDTYPVEINREGNTLIMVAHVPTCTVQLMDEDEHIFYEAEIPEGTKQWKFLLMKETDGQTPTPQTTNSGKAIDRSKADTESIKTSQMTADTLRILIPISGDDTYPVEVKREGNTLTMLTHIPACTLELVDEDEHTLYEAEIPEGTKQWKLPTDQLKGRELRFTIDEISYFWKL